MAPRHLADVCHGPHLSVSSFLPCLAPLTSNATLGVPVAPPLPISPPPTSCAAPPLPSSAPPLLPQLSPPGFFSPTGQAESPRSITGIPDRFNRNRPKPVEFKFQIKFCSSIGLVRYTDRWTKKPNQRRIWRVFKFELKNKRKFSKNIARCIESSGVKKFQILVHLVFFAGIRSSTGQFFLLFFFSWTSNARKVY
jgi:hypothetical protein